jgi:hypothetical protein
MNLQDFLEAMVTVVRNINRESAGHRWQRLEGVNTVGITYGGLHPSSSGVIIN